MNDNERAQWVDNDEGLYNWWRSERPRQSKHAFIRASRAEIDSAISRVTSGNRPAHYLAYGNEAGRYPTSSTRAAEYGRRLAGSPLF